MRYKLDVSATSAGSQNGASLQLDALHSFAVQHHRLVLLVVEALVAIPVTRQHIALMAACDQLRGRDPDIACETGKVALPHQVCLQ